MKVIFYLIFLISFSLKLFVGKAQTMKAYSINAIQGQKVNNFYFTSGSLGASISTDVAYFSHGNSILLPICNYAPHSLTLADGNLISTNISSGSIKWFWNDQLISGATGSSISANQSGQNYNSVSYSSSCEIKLNQIK